MVQRRATLPAVRDIRRLAGSSPPLNQRND